MGKGPENLLLLRSNSVRDESSLKEEGISPLNLLLLRWRRERSVREESSLTRVPCRLAWLRSMEATIFPAGFPAKSRESEQNTPLYEQTFVPTHELVIPSGSSVIADFQAWRAEYALLCFEPELVVVGGFTPPPPSHTPPPPPTPMPTPPRTMTAASVEIIGRSSNVRWRRSKLFSMFV